MSYFYKLHTCGTETRRHSDRLSFSCFSWHPLWCLLDKRYLVPAESGLFAKSSIAVCLTQTSGLQPVFLVTQRFVPFFISQPFWALAHLKQKSFCLCSKSTKRPFDWGLDWTNIQSVVWRFNSTLKLGFFSGSMYQGWIHFTRHTCFSLLQCKYCCICTCWRFDCVLYVLLQPGGKKHLPGLISLMSLFSDFMYSHFSPNYRKSLKNKKNLSGRWKLSQCSNSF